MKIVNRNFVGLFLVLMAVSAPLCGMQHDVSLTCNNVVGVQDYLVKGEIYHLNSERTIEFVWANGVHRVLTAQQVIKLNSGFIWGKLRSDENNFFEQDHNIIYADEIMPEIVFDLLCTLLNTCISAKTTIWSGVQTKKQVTVVTTAIEPCYDISRLSSYAELNQLVLACDFLQAFDILLMIKNYLFDSMLHNLPNFGVDQVAVQLIELLEPIGRRNQIPISPRYYPDGKKIPNLLSILGTWWDYTKFIRICGDKYYHINCCFSEKNVIFSADNHYVTTRESGGNHVWRVLGTIPFSWPLPDPEAQYLASVQPDGTCQVWQLSDDFENLTDAQQLLLKQAMEHAYHDFTRRQCKNLKTIYQNLPDGIRQLLPREYIQHFEWLHWLTKKSPDLGIGLLGLLTTVVYFGFRHRAK